MCNECSCAHVVPRWTLPLAQRVTADFHSRSGPSTGAPDWPLARPGGIGGVAAPVPPGQLLFAKKKGPPGGGPSWAERVLRALADLRLAELDAHVDLLAGHAV